MTKIRKGLHGNLLRSYRPSDTWIMAYDMVIWYTSYDMIFLEYRFNTIICLPWTSQSNTRLTIFKSNWRGLQKIPKLTYKIKDSYFETHENLMSQYSNYEKIDGFYHRTISGDDLDVSFDNPECKCRFEHFKNNSVDFSYQDGFRFVIQRAVWAWGCCFKPTVGQV